MEGPDGEDLLRYDTRLTPTVEWTHAINGLFELVLEHEYEARRSNDPDKTLSTHTLIFGAQVLR